MLFATDYLGILVCVSTPLVSARTNGGTPTDRKRAQLYVRQSEFHLHLSSTGRYGFVFFFFVFKRPFRRKGFSGQYFLSGKKRKSQCCFSTNLIGPIKYNLLGHRQEGKHEGYTHLSFVHGFI